MKNVIFVHGTGVRRSGYEESFSLVQSHLNRDNIDVIPCLWGDDYGVKLNKGGISIPDFDSTRSIAYMSEEDRDVSLWAALYEDSLCELRLLELNQGRAGGFAPNQRVAYQQFNIVLQKLRLEEEVVAQVERCGLTNFWDEAVRRVSGSMEFRQALQDTGSVTTEIRQVVARAFVAERYRSDSCNSMILPTGSREKIVIDLSICWLKSSAALIAG